ncbi:MAG: TonB-dependent receptor [Burkholderiales bacterium]|jgi:vitamin B12 transporter|nr:TonB-dependent receptor [Burkholderiales bacterium]
MAPGMTPVARRALALRPLRMPMLGACALSLWAVHAAQAQTSASVTALPPVVVSASGYPQSLSNALPSVSVITHEQIEESGAQNLTTLLQQAAGVQVTSNGGPGQSGNLYVRGFGGTDVLVLLDGVPINAQDTTGTAYLNNFTSGQIQRIEIIRGNVSAIYGSGAIGGVVLITTRKGEKGPQASVSITAGSRNTATVSANASGEVGKTQLQAGISRFTTQGISSINPEQQSNVNPNANGYRNTTINGSIVQELTPGQSLGLRAFRSEGRASYDSYGSFASPTDTNLSSTTQSLYQLFSDNQLTATWTSHLSLSQQATANTVDNFSASPYSINYRTRTQQLLWRNVIQLDSAWTATAGLDLQRQSITSLTGSFSATSRNANAVFVGLNGAFSGNQIQLNLRHDSIDGYSGQNTVYWGYGRALGGGFKAIASYSTAFNAAPLGYLYAPYYGNPALRPEKAHSAEAGLQWSQGPNVLRATLFQTQATNQWIYDDYTGMFQNIASSRTRGLELTGRGAWDGWAYDTNLTLQQPVNTSLPGDPTLQRRARSLANVSVSHAIGNVLYGATVHYSGPRWDSDANGNPVTLGAYTLVDLTASGPVTPQWSWNARVQNLFDKKYQTAYSYNREPFGVFLGLTWRPLGS